MLGRVGAALAGELTRDLRHRSSKEAQLLLFHTYRDMASRGIVPRFSDVGFRCYSQFEEDGILLFVFALIGTSNRVAVEICAGDGIECMCTNLVLNHGWRGYLFDGDKSRVERGRAFFRRSPDTLGYPPTFTHAWITAENVNGLLREGGVPRDIDLLSLDIDGMDYWVWKAIDWIRPRVVVCEAHDIIGPEDALTVPYDPSFVRTVPDYGGASLGAMTKLAEQKGYRLVGVHRYGFNAFFVLNGLADEVLPAVTPGECLADPLMREGRAARWAKVRDLTWVQV